MAARRPPILAAGTCMLPGQVYLEGKRWTDAEKAFRDDLEEQPGSGLALALMKPGKSADAAEVRTRWEKPGWMGV